MHHHQEIAANGVFILLLSDCCTEAIIGTPVGSILKSYLHGLLHKLLMIVGTQSSSRRLACGFNSRPPRGATRATPRPGIRHRCFNPRPRMGGDSTRRPCQRHNHVSIHAPVCGATKADAPSRPSAAGFNPRPRVGGDRSDGPSYQPDSSFNPRPSVGGDGTPGS